MIAAGQGERRNLEEILQEGSRAEVTVPKPGQNILVRNRPAVVRDVRSFSSPIMAAAHSIQIEYLDGWSHPEVDQVIWEREVGNRVISSLTLPKIGDDSIHPDVPTRFGAFLDAYRWSAINTLLPHREKNPDEVRLIAPWHSAVQIEDYQIYPVLKSLLMPRVSLLLADDVGLGKTIEAGLIISELFARRRIQRVLVVCPASLQGQWRDELKDKFHLDFIIIDRDETFRIKRSLGMDSNPWATFPRIITSMDYLRQRDILDSFQAASTGLTGDDQSKFAWHMLVVDEAHNLFPSRFGDDSDRYVMLKQLSPLFEHKLFLTATPHNGYTVSFTGLLELLDPVRFRQTSIMREHDHKQVHLTMVRRLKSELNHPGETERFSRREVRAVPVSFTKAEKELFAALREYRRAALELLSKVGPRERGIGDFLLTLLTKRLLSSSYAFACTWWQHVEGVQLGGAETDAMNQAVTRAETSTNDDEEKDFRDMDVARQGGAWLFTYAQALKPEMEAVGEKLQALGWNSGLVAKGLTAINEPPPDVRWDELIGWVDTHLKKDGRFHKDERLILFTEYKHTLDYLLSRFSSVGIISPQMEYIYGGIGASSTRRNNIKEAFNDPESPLRILLATDTASEGINLQTSCRFVFHQEIPWNPMRLEQRNGRVDRYGQARNVYVFHFTSTDEADLKFMGHVLKKVEQAREDLGSVGQVIDQAILEHFTRIELDEAALDQRVETVKKDEVDTQDIQSRDRGTEDLYSRSLQRLRSTELAMGLSPQGLAALLQQALEIEKGSLIATDEPNVYRIRIIPPGWKKLVQEALEIKKGNLQGSLPKLVFDPSYFETYENGRKIYNTRTDAVLIRLGHPLMRRAIGTLRRHLWDGRELSRWTITARKLPAGVNELLILYTTLEITNDLRETVHQEVSVTPFQVHGDHLTPLVDELWQQLSHLESHQVPAGQLASQVSRVTDQWIGHDQQLREFLKDQLNSYRTEFENRMAERLKEELAEEKAKFDSRLKELGSEPKWLERQRAEMERQRLRLQQGALFDELRLQQEQKLKSLEWEVMHSHIEQMRQLLEHERDRMLEKILPKRYSLASVDLQPLAIEYVVDEKVVGVS